MRAVLILTYLFVATVFCGPAWSQSSGWLWESDFQTVQDLGKAQDKLLLTLRNSNALKTITLMSLTNETPHQAFQRAGSWVGPATEASASLLCSLNPSNCPVKTNRANASVLRQATKHVDGYALNADSLDWVNSPNEGPLTVSSVQVRQLYEIGSFDEAQNISAKLTATDLVRLNVKLGKNAPQITSYVLGNYVTAKDHENSNVLKPVTLEIISSGRSRILKFNPRLVAWIDPTLSLPNRGLEIIAPDLNLLSQDQSTSVNPTSINQAVQSLRKNINGSFRIDTQARHEVVPDEPLMTNEKQAVLFDTFWRFDQFPLPLPDLSGKVSVIITDQKPIRNHCDLIGAPVFVKWLDGDRKGGDLPPFKMDDPLDPAIHSVPDCAGQEAAQTLSQHGTHTLGILAARANDKAGAGLLSMASGIEYVFVPVDMDRLGRRDGIVAGTAALQTPITETDRLTYRHLWAAAISEVREPDSVVNMSLTYQVDRFDLDPIWREIKKTDDKVLWVVAAGNYGDNANEGMCNVLPACLRKAPNVLSVVAVERNLNGKFWPLQTEDEIQTNHGSEFFDLAAPGRNIWSTVNEDGYAAADGTSPATVVATAAAALLRATRPMTPKQTIERLIYTSDLSGDLTEASFGGVVNPILALSHRKHVIRTKKHSCVLTTDTVPLENNPELRILSISGEDSYHDQGKHYDISWREILRIHSTAASSILFYKRGDNNKLRRIEGKINFADLNLQIINPDLHDNDTPSPECVAQFGDVVSTLAISDIAEFARKME